MGTAETEVGYGVSAPLYETRHDDDTSLGVTIIDAIAAVEEIDPMCEDLGLYESVDLEAVETLFEHRPSGERWRFEFTAGGYTVIVDGDGFVTVFE
ncbi:HalOD1 output domain-containing protein [Halorussus halophilus]|uniref:HalOD1 output domain-containing protein n=1 Tax=Halorussus halophilus TaxID=2650975 RepID=UPI001300CB88|nr:HalOD1 output domain-containing protein [Halorussus halophilus]